MKMKKWRRVNLEAGLKRGRGFPIGYCFGWLNADVLQTGLLMTTIDKLSFIVSFSTSYYHELSDLRTC